MYTEDLVSIDMFPESFQPIIELIGMEKTLVLIKNYAGSMIYIPKLDCCKRHYRNQAILEEHQAGERCIILARKYNLTPPGVRKIIRAQLQLGTY